MFAPRLLACWYSSRIKLAAPSPITKPSRPWSKGRQAIEGCERLMVRIKANAPYVKGLKGAYEAPAIITSAQPSRIYRRASPIATFPLAQLFEFVVPTPRNPNSIAILQCADPPKTCNASMWLTDLGPPPTKALCWIPAFETPPSAVPKLTPILSWGLSAEYSRPLSSRASLAEATANWAYLSNRFNRCGEKYSSGFQSSTSAELVALKTDGSNPETGPIPDLRSLMAAQNFFLPTPIDVIGPTPVMTTRLIVR